MGVVPRQVIYRQVWKLKRDFFALVGREIKVPGMVHFHGWWKSTGSS